MTISDRHVTASPDSAPSAEQPTLPLTPGSPGASRRTRSGGLLAEQLGFELWERTHDLPPRWDGMAVEWGAWTDTAGIIMCPPPKDPDLCGKCGSTRARLLCTGRMWTDPATTTVAAIASARMHRGRHLVGILAAFRCPDCDHDTVLDPIGQQWDLDETDYGHAGSSFSDTRPRR